MFVCAALKKSIKLKNKIKNNGENETKADGRNKLEGISLGIFLLLLLFFARWIFDFFVKMRNLIPLISREVPHHSTFSFSQSRAASFLYRKALFSSSHGFTRLKLPITFKAKQQLSWYEIKWEMWLVSSSSHSLSLRRVYQIMVFDELFFPIVIINIEWE